MSGELPQPFTAARVLFEPLESGRKFKHICILSFVLLKIICKPSPGCCVKNEEAASYFRRFHDGGEASGLLVLVGPGALSLRRAKSENLSARLARAA
jgi:hypothetical protein